MRSEQAWTTWQEQKGVNGEEEEAEAKRGRSREGKKGEMERNQLPIYTHGHVSQVLSSPSQGKRHPAQSWSPVSHRAAELFSWVCCSNTL